MAKKLFLLDGMALVYRAHFAFATRPILTSKGVTTDTETHSANWTQLVFNLLSGPVVSAAVAAAAVKPAA